MSTATESTIDMYGELRRRYPNAETSRGQWVTAQEVRSFTGFGSHVRSCDFLAMSCWPSKGLHLHGHEVKTARSDWLKEIQDVSKAGAFTQYCHYWWIVAPKGIVKLEELPATWGLLHCTAKTSLRVARPATLNENATIDWDFFASVLRTAVCQSDAKKAIDAARSEGYRSGREDGLKQSKHYERTDAERYKRLAEEHERTIKRFQDASGLEIDSWDAGRVGEVVRAMQTLGIPKSIEAKVENAITQVEAIAEALKVLKQVAGEV